MCIRKFKQSHFFFHFIYTVNVRGVFVCDKLRFLSNIYFSTYTSPVLTVDHLAGVAKRCAHIGPRSGGSKDKTHDIFGNTSQSAKLWQPKTSVQEKKKKCGEKYRFQPFWRQCSVTQWNVVSPRISWVWYRSASRTIQHYVSR